MLAHTEATSLDYKRIKRPHNKVKRMEAMKIVNLQDGRDHDGKPMAIFTRRSQAVLRSELTVCISPPMVHKVLREKHINRR